MTSTPEILLVLLLLQVKHAVFDGPLQRQWMLREKGFYGKRGGLAHAGLHGLGTFMALAILAQGLGLSLLLAAFDAAIHYHVDFIKETIVRRYRWTSVDNYFWWALSADQMFHQFTYLAIAAAIIQFH